MKTLLGSTAGCLVVGLVAIACASLGGFALIYDIEHLAPLFVHHAVTVPHSILVFFVGAVISQIAIPVALVTFILHLVGVV